MKKPVNPYQKKSHHRRRISRKQWTAIISLVSVLAIIVGITLAGNLSKASIADPHAGHNHAPGEDCGTATVDPHAGHNHGADEESNANTGVLSHRVYANADKTYRVQVVNKQNQVVFEKDKLYNTPIREDISADFASLGWATGKGTNDFEHIFWNTKTGATSAVFYAPRVYDGVRVAYSSADQTKIIVQDIFNKTAYYKEYPLTGVYTKGTTIIQSGKVQADKKSVRITYVTDEKGSTHQVVIPLYE